MTRAEAATRAGLLVYWKGGTSRSRGEAAWAAVPYSMTPAAMRARPPAKREAITRPMGTVLVSPDMSVLRVACRVHPQGFRLFQEIVAAIWAQSSAGRTIAHVERARIDRAQSVGKFRRLASILPKDSGHAARRGRPACRDGCENELKTQGQYRNRRQLHGPPALADEPATYSAGWVAPCADVVGSGMCKNSAHTTADTKLNKARP